MKNFFNIRIYTDKIRINSLCILLLSLCVNAFAAPQSGKNHSANTNSINPNKFLTHYEKNGYNHTPRYAETVVYCKLLAEASAWISYTSIGVSAQGRDIPLLIVDKDGCTTPEQARQRGKTVVLVEACIHAGEPDGKEAGLMLIRDIAIHKQHPELLEKVTLLFLPIFNPDGHEQFSEYNRINQNGPVELGTRATAQRINLNRDFIKADAPEMRHWLKFYNQWNPELFIDVHVTNGADFQYVITYALENAGYTEKGLMEWTQQVFEKKLKEGMKKDGFPIFPYFSFKEYNKPEKGIVTEIFPPLYSHGYAASRNRIGLLLENHIYKPYKQRVDATYRLLINALALTNTHSKELQEKISQADAYTASLAFREKPFALSYKNTFADSIPDTFLGWKANTLKSDLSGGEWIVQDYNTPVSTPTHIYTSFAPDKTVNLPEAYVISAEMGEVIELLNVHGIRYTRLAKECILEVETYRFTTKSQWAKTPYEGRFTLKPDFTIQTETVTYPTNSVIVQMNQPLAKIVAFLLEPNSPTSLVYWGLFNNYIRPASEFFINLRYMEVKGREMLEKDPALRAEFEQEKLNNPEFKTNPNAVLQFFMAKLRQNVEPNSNLYPVGRLVAADVF